MRGRPLLYTSYESDQAILNTWTKKIVMSVASPTRSRMREPWYRIRSGQETTGTICGRRETELPSDPGRWLTPGPRRPCPGRTP